MWRIIDYRAYAKAYGDYKEGLKETDVTKRPQSPMIDRVKEIVFDIQLEKLKLKQAAEVKVIS